MVIRILKIKGKLMKTKISLLFERGDEEYRIPLSFKELDTVLGHLYCVLPFGKEKWPKSIRDVKSFVKFLDHLQHAVNDVYHNGTVYELLPEDKRIFGKRISKKCKDKFYSRGKPKWVNRKEFRL